MDSPAGHDNPLGNNNREGTRVILREITATLQNSPPSKTPTKNKTGLDVTKTPEHEIKVKFAREFIEITDDQTKKTDKQINDNNSLSSASSIQSLTSTLSTKSSSGICIDSPSRSFDISYANSDIPGIDDLLSACAGIRLEDSYADASFASANDQSNLDITQNIAEYKTNDNNLNKTQEICKLNLTQDNFISSVDDQKNLNTQADDTLTDIDTTDLIHSLPITSDSCVSSDSEHTFSSSLIDLNKTKDTVKEEIISQAQNNIEFDNCKFVVHEESNVPSDADNLSFVETNESLQVTDTESIVDDNNVVEKSEVNLTNDISVDQATQAIESLSIENIIDNTEDIITPDKIEESDVEKSNVIFTLNQTVELSEPLVIEKELDHKDNIAPSEIKEADEQLNIVTVLNQTIELSQPLVIEKNIDNQDNITSSHVEQTDEQSNTGCYLNDTFEIPEQQLTTKKDFDHQENIISSEKSHEKLNVVADLNSTVELSQPLLNNINIDDNITVKSDEETVFVENTSAKFNESSSINQFDKLKTEIFEALAAEKTSDDVVSITNEITSPLLIDNNQDFSQQQEQQPKNTALNDDDTLSCAVENTTVVKENTFDLATVVNVDKDKSLNCASNVFLHDDNNTGFINSDYDFDKLKLEAKRVANDLYNTSIEYTEDKEEEFVLASTDLFIDPMSVDLSSLNSNKTTNTKDNTAIDRLRAESLYVKFDPLVSNLTMLPQGNISTSQKNDTTINGDNNDTCISELNSSPKRNPAIAAIDRLLIYSPIPPSSVIDKKNKEQEKILTREKTPEPITIIDTTMAKELELVRTNVIQLEEQIEQQKVKYHTDIKTINDDKEKLELQNITLRDTINQLKKELQQEIKNKNQVTIIVDEFRKTIERLNMEKEKDKNNYDNIKTNLYEELQDAKNHLTATEAAFNDVHAKYEKLKIVVTESRNNEKILKESIEENIETIKLLENRYEQIKSHAAARLEKANHELDTIRKQHESDNVRVRAMLRKEELKSNSLAELVEQKTKENKELTQILDEVISRVGQKSDD